MYYFYFKNKFEKKLIQYQKEIFCATTIDIIQQNDYYKFMKSKHNYSIKKSKRIIFEIYYSEIEMFN